MAKNTNTLEADILAFCDGKVKPQGAKEGRQKFLKRLLGGLEKLVGDNAPNGDEKWEAASDAIQSWYKDALEADQADEDLPDVAPAAKSEKSEKAETAASNGHTKKAATKASATPKTSKAKIRAPRARKQDGKIDKILGVCFANPSKGVDEITEMLAKKNVEAKRATVWSVRVNLIRTCAFLHDAGKLKDNPFSAGV